MNAQPSVHATGSGPCLTARISGTMDYETAAFFRNRLLDEVTGDRRYVVLDLSAVSFCDSSGLNVLLWAWRQAAEAGAVLVLACVPPALQRTLTRTGVDSLLRVYGTVAEAENAITAE
ncbi:STAS domain-containing protein [Streptomyces sp. NBC_00557]|uniref:STAS domain-containing protein n=1 Tax=Streptomyces sp. NBC_00557 TaxID=2975776 RepID=UPI002E7FECD5|nr:STAS domain-containing protein [Streptomyces sp. NBC_00557]WUC39436.1 STAS domain-containing protein [Streptomyces sp. NBC_00557]